MRALLGGIVGLAASIAIPATFHGTRFLVALWVITGIGSSILLVWGIRDWQRRRGNPQAPAATADTERRPTATFNIGSAEHVTLERVDSTADEVLRAKKIGPFTARQIRHRPRGLWS